MIVEGKQFKIGDKVHAPKTAFGNGEIILIRADDIVVKFCCGMVSGWSVDELKLGHVEQYKRGK